MARAGRSGPQGRRRLGRGARRAVPGFLALDAVWDERDPNARAILSHAWPAPDAVRLAGDDEILVIGWEHASAIPPDWELGDALRAWSEGSDLELGAAAAQSLLDAYRELADGPERLELSMFASSVTAVVNWIATRVQIALTCDDEERRDLANRNLPALLEDPISPQRSSSCSATSPRPQPPRQNGGAIHHRPEYSTTTCACRDPSFRLIAAPSHGLSLALTKDDPRSSLTARVRLPLRFRGCGSRRLAGEAGDLCPQRVRRRRR